MEPMNREFSMSNNKVWHRHEEEFIYIYSYCFVTKGFAKVSVIDTCQQKFYLFNKETYELFKILKTHKIKEIIEMFSRESELDTFNDFVTYILQNEIGRFVKNIICFPEIEEVWDEPRIIKKALIDIRKIFHDFKSIFSQLSDLGCRNVEIRSYRVLHYNELEEISNCVSNDSIRHINIVSPFFSFFDSIEEINNLIKQNPRLHLSFYKTPIEEKIKFEKHTKNEILLSNKIKLSTININSCDDCGNIDVNRLKIPTLDEYMENKIYNGCLNRQIGIDENGDIKNCPSFEFAYGNIKNTNLSDVVKNPDFQKYWHINKEKIDVCRECEFRVICIDCRAYVLDKNNIYSKPLKCNYNQLH